MHSGDQIDGENMISKSRKITGFAAVSALAASVLLQLSTPVQAQNLFDFLFGGNRTRVVEPPPPPPPVKRTRISAPSYYGYKTDPIIAVKFKETLGAPLPNGLEPSLAPSGFSEARQALETIDLMEDKKISAALDSYYAERQDFVWVTGYHPNAKALAAIEVLAKADEYGLVPDDYAVTVPGETFSMDDVASRQADLVQFDVTLSARVLRYVQDARNGRINPNRLSGYHDLPVKNLNLKSVLAQLAHTSEVATYLETRHPGNEAYVALKNELAELGKSEDNEIVINDLKFLKPGGSHPEFPKVLSIIKKNSPEAVQIEFGELIAANLGSETYTNELVPLIKAAQKAAGTKPDGIIGRNTVAAFFGESRQSKIDRVKLAMERLRWLPSNLGSRRVFVNQPAFMASYYEGGQEKLSMRVIVGKRSNQTSFFYDEIESVDYNPYWGVPQSIIVNEMLPRLVTDPGYLDRAGYEVTNAKGQRISSSSVNWGQYGGKVPYNVRQTPGERNALGELKILFPNKHAIYMHDTPTKNLFSREARAFSHGCIRLQEPRAMAAAVLGQSEGYVASKLKQGHGSEKVPQKIPVYVAYFTAWPNADGKVGYYEDMYGRDKHLLESIAIVEALRAKTS